MRQTAKDLLTNSHKLLQQLQNGLFYGTSQVKNAFQSDIENTLSTVQNKGKLNLLSHINHSLLSLTDTVTCITR